MTLDKHTLALLSIIGNTMDVIGALYLAYDLLGGEHGPLRTLTRGVTYAVLFGIGYGLAIGPVFGVIAGIAHGITLGWEFSRASRGEAKPGLGYDAAMSAIRGLGFALGSAYRYGVTFGVTFGILSTVGQVIAYRAGIRPTIDYHPATRPRLTLRQILATGNRAVGYAVGAYISAFVSNQRGHALGIGIKGGLTIGAVTAIVTSCSPFVEWTADHVPEKRMGVFGIALILFGFALQSIQYWVALLT